ncbi:MAG: biotin synthase [Piscinibacter sp.]|nr:biotin synthase [Piscinibacter sp.]
MSDPRAPIASARGLDEAAVTHIVRRLARAAQPPWLHREVARRMAERLALIRLQPALLIDWSSWLGAGADLLKSAYPQARRVQVEPMAELAARGVPQTAPRWWTAARWQGNAPQVLAEPAPLPRGAQLVWSNMALHGVADPPALFGRWYDALAADGFVMFSCLGPGTLRELRALYTRQGWPAPTPGFVDMHDLGDMLVQAGFADPVMDQEVLQLSWPDPEALLGELRALGGNAAPERLAGLRTPRWRACLRDALASLAGPDGRIAMSFEVAYGHAFRGAPRARAGEATRVSLQDMRTMVRSGRPGPVR